MNAKRIILCADDYGLTPAISKGILQLVDHACINAVSCMTNTPHWSEHAKWLAPHTEKAIIGLHFALTDVAPVYIKPFKLSELIIKAYRRQLDITAVRKEMVSQIDRFQAALGKLPDFIDGHQHIQQLPVIRNALISVYRKYFPNKNVFVRISSNGRFTLKKPWHAIPKRWMVTSLGAHALKKLLVAHHIPHNTTFAGIYHFKKAKHYPRYFQNFLAQIKDGGLIMCHPGLEDTNTRDVIAQSRFREFQYLMRQK